jgi:hypothetical protein
MVMNEANVYTCYGTDTLVSIGIAHHHLSENLAVGEHAVIPGHLQRFGSCSEMKHGGS